MTRWTFRALGLIAVTTGLALAQPAKKEPAPKEPPKPAAGSLEDTLEKALRNSADIKVAEAKVRDADAELNRVRQQVLMRGTTLHNELRVAKKLLEAVETIYTQTQQGYEKSVIPLVELLPSRLAFEKQKAEVEKLEAELKAFRGEFAIHRSVSSVAFSPDGQYLSVLTDGKVRLWDASSGREVVSPADVKGVWDLARAADRPAVQSSMAERIRKWLDQEVESKLGQENELRLEDAFGLVRNASTDPVPVRMMNNTEDHQYRNNLQGQIRIGALLQAMEDGGEKNLAFVVRDYGLLVTTTDRVPEGAVRALDFWKAAEEKKTEPAKK